MTVPRCTAIKVAFCLCMVLASIPTVLQLVTPANAASTQTATSSNPAVSITSPAYGSVISSNSNQTSYPFSGTCNQSGELVYLVYYNTAGVQAFLGSSTCTGSLWNMSVNVSAVQFASTIEFKASMENTAGVWAAYATTLAKSSAAAPSPNAYGVTPFATNVTVSPAAAQAVAPGSQQTFTVTPYSGAAVSATVGGNCPAGSWSGSTYKTGAINANCYVIFYSGNVWYASPSAGSGGNGTKGNPFADINQFFYTSGVKPGDVLVLECGTYAYSATTASQNLYWPSQFNHIVIQGDGPLVSRGANGCAYITTSAPPPQTPAAVEFGVVSHVALRNVDITDTATAAPGADCITFDTDSSNQSYSNNIDLEFDTVHGCAANGISSVWNAHIWIENNITYGNSGGSNDKYCNSGISILQPVDDQSGGYSVSIKNNTGYSNINNPGSKASCSDSDGEFIIIDGGPDNGSAGGCASGPGAPNFSTCMTASRILIQNNYGYGNGGAGIEVYNDNNTDISDNTLSKNQLSHLTWHIGEIEIDGSQAQNGHPEITVNSFNISGNVLTEDGSAVPAISCAYASNVTVSGNTNEGPGSPFLQGSNCQASYSP